MSAIHKPTRYGNDFLYRATQSRRRAPSVGARRRFAREMCDRHTGIGADGLIVYERDARRRVDALFNADGSRAEVSGNGVRGAGRARCCATTTRRPR